MALGKDHKPLAAHSSESSPPPASVAAAAAAATSELGGGWARRRSWGTGDGDISELGREMGARSDTGDIAEQGRVAGVLRLDSVEASLAASACRASTSAGESRRRTLQNLPAASG